MKIFLILMFVFIGIGCEVEYTTKQEEEEVDEEEYFLVHASEEVARDNEKYSRETMGVDISCSVPETPEPTSGYKRYAGVLECFLPEGSIIAVDFHLYGDINNFQWKPVEGSNRVLRDGYDN